MSGIVPTNAWKQDALGAPMFPGETYQAGIGQGYDAVTPLQLINAYAALANGGTLYQPQIVREVIGPDGEVVRPFEPKVLHKMKVKTSVLRIDAQRGPRDRDAAPHVQPRRPADQDRRQVRYGRVRRRRTPRAACRTRRSSSGSRRRTRATARSTSHDSELVVMAFAHDSRTEGNAATEIVKYFFQLHYGIEKDYRLPELLERGNFYSND